MVTTSDVIGLDIPIRAVFGPFQRDLLDMTTGGGLGSVASRL